ncbi:hypothetical protein G7Y89_g12216 [Cudoniella acicularis]|uniref:Glycosyltransferase family 31 protein n=1 Tax=Cudoniella acicularis TaxID=354080 RepID=A0A8H4VZV8_9HELO|nr:hypothetical protein G7Y89_g12216 [Cudoniella acicularis]
MSPPLSPRLGPGSSRFGIWGFPPRHTKGYLWITFLVGVFLLMALSENGMFERDSGPPYTGLVPDNHSLKFEPESIVMTPQSQPTSNPSKSLKPSSPSQEIISETKLEPKPVVKEESGRITTLTGLDPKDVVILVKTGATSIWRRMPAHMSTTLGNPNMTPNIIYYSDSPDNINGNPVIDVLANVSASLKASPDFELYSKAKEVKNNNLYLESGSMEGDSYLPGGWRLDKYKFVPMFAHAAATMPGKKWYIYMEDDNYYFWETLYAWLATLDHTKSLMVGSPAFRLGEDFAHGGSGFAISGQALATTFGVDKKLADKYEDYSREQCCGDQVLSHVLREMGVTRYNELDGGSWAALQALPTWRIGFGRWNWCSPIMNIHKVHQADISRLHVFEKEFKANTEGSPRLRYRDIFAGLASEPMLSTASRTEWDNYASAKTFLLLLIRIFHRRRRRSLLLKWRANLGFLRQLA